MTDVENPLVSVVIPVYCEAPWLRAVLRDVQHSLEQCHVRHEIILVDDGSPDQSWQVITSEIREAPDKIIRAFRLSRNFGKEAALCAGLEQACGDAVIVMDADGQHPASVLCELVRTWKSSGADIVEGVKIHRGRESLPNKFVAAIFYFLLNKLSGFDFRGASDFKLLNRKAVTAWLQMPERNVFFRGMTTWLGFTSRQVPFEVAVRSGGRSAWSLFQRVRLALTGITAFSWFPLQLVTVAGAVFLAFSVLLAAQTMYLKLSGQAVSGFATVILLELIIGSCLMISLGVIGEYLARIYEEVKGRPRYLIAESLDSTNEAARPK